MRGALYPGALTALEEAGVLQHVKSYAGTSAGSGTAACCLASERRTLLRPWQTEKDFSRGRKWKISLIWLYRENIALIIWAWRFTRKRVRVTQFFSLFAFSFQ